MPQPYPHKAKDRVEALAKTLRPLVERDPDQEVQGIAVAALDAAIEAIKAEIPEDPVVRSITGIITPETIEAGDPVRAADALLVVDQLDAALGRRPSRVSTARHQLDRFPSAR